jgi:hypothetical protein
LFLLTLPIPGGSVPAISAEPPDRVVREGIVVEFSYAPVEKKEAGGKVLEGEFAEARFKVTDEATGKPVRALRPGAWMDISKPLGKDEKAPLECREKVSLYLRGIVGIRPMIDLNGYFVLVMNREPSIYVVDPLGNLMMRFDARENPKGLLSDMKKLLKLSHIG